MKRYSVRLWGLGLVLLLLPLGAANGQASLPHENHYKVYIKVPTAAPQAVARHLQLIDQFGPIQVDSLVLERWANPATKIHDGVSYPPVDPMVHQTWWRIINPPPLPARTVIGIDQFGYGPVTLGRPVYLLNPALKNPQPGIPPIPPYWNHYLCYEVIGAQPLLKPVLLYDQWGTSQVVVVRSKLFCNPTEKMDLVNGKIDPILDFRAHLQCYFIDNPIAEFHPVYAVDQFGYWQIETYQNDCLCVPALKEHIVGTNESTWGQIKALYR